MEKDSSEPGIIINFGKHEFEATRDNTSLFRFFGHLAMYNHVFFATDPENGQGTYLFNQNPAYATIERYMIENQYPIHDNLRDVAECDSDAFEQMLRRYVDDTPDSFPEDWA